MPRSKAQAKASVAWDKANMKSITVRLRKTKVETIEELAAKQKISRDAWVKAAIDEKLERER
jgi:predicted HicB family RNase H-like nuclease